MNKNDVVFADKIAALCFNKYASLSKNGKPVKDKEWTLLAGFVVEISNQFQVVSLATGTKCIGRNSMTADGTVLNDSHAEILARRCLLRYFYQQLEKIRKGQTSKLFHQHKTKKDKFDSNNFKLHMFTSHVPCGDASIVLKEDDLSSADSTFKNKAFEDVSKEDNKSENYAKEIGASVKSVQEVQKCSNFVSVPGVDDKNENSMKIEDQSYSEKNRTNHILVPGVDNTNKSKVLVENCSNDKAKLIINESSEISTSRGKFPSTIRKNRSFLTDSVHDSPTKKRKTENNCNTCIEESINDTGNVNSETTAELECDNVCLTVEISRNIEGSKTEASYHSNHDLIHGFKSSENHCRDSCSNNTVSVESNETTHDNTKSFHSIYESSQLQNQLPVCDSSPSVSSSMENNTPVSETYNTSQKVSSRLNQFGFCKDTDNVGDIVPDIHRTGAKCLPHSKFKDAKDPGIGYHVVGVVRTKPGRGDPTLSVSCSDKMARWVALGVQGALLSTLLDRPIHVSSITVGGGGPYSADSMLRALVLRSGTNQKPLLLRSNLIFESSRYILNKNCKPCASSIMWTDVPERSCEVSAKGYRLGATKTAGALEKATSICRRNLYKQFIQITGERFIISTYSEAKKSSSEYLESWSRVKTHMGSWTEKEAKRAKFTIDVKELS